MAETVELICTSNNAAANFVNTITIQQEKADCTNVLVPIASPLNQLSFDLTSSATPISLFTETPAPGCTYTCHLFDNTCPSSTPLSGTELSFSPSSTHIQALRNINTGYSKPVCMTCTSIVSDTYIKEVTIVQSQAPCDQSLMPRGKDGKELTKMIAFIHGGVGETFGRGDFFDENKL